MRIAEHEAALRRMFAKARVDSPGLCARLLVAHAAGLDSIAYILAFDQELSPENEQYLAGLAARRASGEPLAYILGSKEFYGLDFEVSGAVLTPRPETELLVELALAGMPEDNACVFVDAGCGSGCIGLALLRNRPCWRGFLLDNSWPALQVAELNRQKHGLCAVMLSGDMFHLPFAPSSLDLLVCNPPYIGHQEKAEVMGETLAYEPHSALFSGKGGLAHLEAVIHQAAICLKKGGLLLLEHGWRQGEAVRQMLNDRNFVDIALHEDLAGLPRCAAARR